MFSPGPSPEPSTPKMFRPFTTPSPSTAGTPKEMRSLFNMFTKLTTSTPQSGRRRSTPATNLSWRTSTPSSCSPRKIPKTPTPNKTTILSRNPTPSSPTPTKTRRLTYPFHFENVNAARSSTTSPKKVQRRSPQKNTPSTTQKPKFSIKKNRRQSDTFRSLTNFSPSTPLQSPPLQKPRHSPPTPHRFLQSTPIQQNNAHSPPNSHRRLQSPMEHSRIPASPMPSCTRKIKKTPADARQMKILPRRPSKREASRARKLSMTDFESCSHATPPHPKRSQRRGSCFEGPTRGLMFRMRSNSLTGIERDPFRELTDAIVARGIKLFALDFDLTFISCHTRSQWYGTSEELARHVRPSIRKLVTSAVASGLLIAIVSFSGQGQLVRDTVARALTGIDTSKFAFCCSDKKWKVSDLKLTNLFTRLRQGNNQLLFDNLGKLKHMCHAAEQLCGSEKENAQCIIPGNILLLDDDAGNVSIAQSQGVTAVQMLPDQPEAFFSFLTDIFLPHS